MTRRDGLFIAFEGGDGAGKSTQVRLLAQALRARGRRSSSPASRGAPSSARRSATSCCTATTCRRGPRRCSSPPTRRTTSTSSCARRSTRGEVVITDRYTDSSVAYQGAGRDLGAAEVHDLQMWAVDGLVPALTVVVDVTAAEGRRRRGDTHDRLESEEDAFHEAIRQHFLSMAAGHPERYLVVDGTEPPERLHDAVLGRLEAMGLVDP